MKSSMNQLQQRVSDFVAENQLQTDVAYRSLALMSEVGELAKEVLKATDYGTKPFQTNNDWAEELGDVFFTVIILANSTGVALDVALSDVLLKFNKRVVSTRTPGSG
jgi:NTP pyrophosphatase (non-canonical NTP hydrolase)